MIHFLPEIESRSQETIYSVKLFYSVLCLNTLQLILWIIDIYIQPSSVIVNLSMTLNTVATS